MGWGPGLEKKEAAEQLGSCIYLSASARWMSCGQLPSALAAVTGLAWRTVSPKTVNQDKPFQP